MSRPASRRTPAHERAVREGRLAQYEAHTLAQKLEALQAASRTQIAELEERVHLQTRIKEQYASDLSALHARMNGGCLVSGEDWITLCDRLGLPAVPIDAEKKVSQVLDAVLTLATHAEKAEQESKSIQGLNDLLIEARDAPIPMRIPCPRCGTLHVDEGEFATRPHSTHTCQHCGECFKPCLRPTVGVRFLPGTKNGETA